ncbi:MAG: glycoside hydrolase family 3 C-terminal domain-containing protein [Bacteroidota bacterium]
MKNYQLILSDFFFILAAEIIFSNYFIASIYMFITPTKSYRNITFKIICPEKPYAEMQGDSEDLSLTGSLAHEANKQTIQYVKSLNKPTVSILLTGRHLVDLRDYLDDWGSIVIAYLPGSEGGQGIANVLVGEKNFVGKLPMPWYNDVNDIRKENAELLFKIGYGLSY